MDHLRPGGTETLSHSPWVIAIHGLVSHGAALEANHLALTQVNRWYQLH
jgi:hypothetical protein